jgi:hypothetical protein
MLEIFPETLRENNIMPESMQQERNSVTLQQWGSFSPFLLKVVS